MKEVAFNLIFEAAALISANGEPAGVDTDVDKEEQNEDNSLNKSLSK